MTATSTLTFHPERLASAFEWRHYAKVTVAPWKPFPLDMLRYDCCVFDSGHDSDHAEQTIRSPDRYEVVIIVKTWSETKDWPFTDELWESYGCKIERI